LVRLLLLLLVQALLLLLRVLLQVRGLVWVQVLQACLWRACVEQGLLLLLRLWQLLLLLLLVLPHLQHCWCCGRQSCC
jgi:hypothetical protein